jgi:xanthine/CO dehydrogenase XdhC/CoxF family maturation factor
VYLHPPAGRVAPFDTREVTVVVETEVEVRRVVEPDRRAGLEGNPAYPDALVRMCTSTRPVPVLRTLKAPRSSARKSYLKFAPSASERAVVLWTSKPAHDVAALN